MILAAPRIVPRLNTLFGQLKYARPHQKPLGALIPSTSSWPHPAPATTPVFGFYVPFSTLGLNAGSGLVMARYARPPQAPLLFSGTPESVKADAQRLCDKTRTLLDRMVADVSPASASFANTVRPMVDNEQENVQSEDILNFYQYVSADPELRKASLEADKVLSDFKIETTMREDVFRLVDAVYKNTGLETTLAKNKGQGSNGIDKPVDDATAKSLDLEDAETARLLQKMYKEYINYGLTLPAGEKRDRFRTITKRLSDLAIEFSKNLNEENGGIWLTREELSGVPADVVDSLEKGTGDNEGKLKLTFKYPDLIPAQEYAKSTDVRQRIEIGYANRVRPPGQVSASWHDAFPLTTPVRFYRC